MSRKRRKGRRRPRRRNDTGLALAASSWATGRDDALLAAVQAMRAYGDDWADVQQLAVGSGRAPATIRRALNELAQGGVVERAAGRSAPGYFGKARFVYRLGEDEGQAHAQHMVQARQVEAAQQFDPQAFYEARHAFDFDPSAWEEEGPEVEGADPYRFELPGPEQVRPGVFRWAIQDGLVDFAEVARGYAARGWAAAGEDRALKGVPDALVVLTVAVRPSHRRLGLSTRIYEAMLDEAARVQVPLASPSDRTYGSAKWWARQARKGRARLRRYPSDGRAGASRYLVGEDGRYPDSLNPPRRR